MSEDSSINDSSNEESSSPQENGEELSIDEPIDLNPEKQRKVSQDKKKEPIDLTQTKRGNISPSEQLIDLTRTKRGNISPGEQRKTLKLWITGILAGSLWLILLLIVVCHFKTVNNLTNKLAEVTPISDNMDNSIYVKEAINATDETAKTIYTFLGPLAAAVTGYFFEEARKAD